MAKANWPKTKSSWEVIEETEGEAKGLFLICLFVGEKKSDMGLFAKTKADADAVALLLNVHQIIPVEFWEGTP